MSFGQKLRRVIQHDIFGQEELRLIYPDASDASLHSGISRALSAKEVIKLKRCLYLFSKDFQINSISKFKIANKIYDPSYVSFESALSFYGLIPEAVYETTSACFLRKSKNFTNELGEFSYNYVPCRPFFIGVTSRDGVLMASPLRALFDYIYYRRKSYETIHDLEDDLRIESVMLRNEVTRFNYVELRKLSQAYRKKGLDQFCELLVREFK